MLSLSIIGTYKSLSFNKQHFLRSLYSNFRTQRGIRHAYFSVPWNIQDMQSGFRCSAIIARQDRVHKLVQFTCTIPPGIFPSSICLLDSFSMATTSRERKFLLNCSKLSPQPIYQFSLSTYFTPAPWNFWLHRKNIFQASHIVRARMQFCKQNSQKIMKYYKIPFPKSCNVSPISYPFFNQTFAICYIKYQRSNSTSFQQRHINCVSSQYANFPRTFDRGCTNQLISKFPDKIHYV